MAQDPSDETMIDERELRERRDFFDIRDEDLERLLEIRPLAEAHLDEIVEAFYEILLGHPRTRVFFPDESTVTRVKRLQRRYFQGLFSGRCDLGYVEDRLRVGTAHERVGLPPKWYLGAYAHYLRLLFDRMAVEDIEPERLHAAYNSLQKMVFFDAALAMDSYFASHLRTVREHRTAIEELSTPVIRVYDRVLLLPLVGTVDSYRAQQIMETVLTRIIEEQAKVMILDIAGVPVVDTQVADHLLKTTTAVKLLGAETVLTGISAQIARTVVQLGVDITTMHTCSRLSDGVELALAIVDKAIGPRQPRPTPTTAQ